MQNVNVGYLEIKTNCPSNGAKLVNLKYCFLVICMTLKIVQRKGKQYYFCEVDDKKLQVLNDEYFM